jgi:S-formylglutathione hydrolase FrmB
VTSLEALAANAGRKRFLKRTMQRNFMSDLPAWEQVEIAGKSASLFEPQPGPPRFGLIYLHTFNQESLAGNETFSRLFNQLRLACVCPQGKRSWWADRICSEFDPELSSARYVIDEVLPFMLRRFKLPERSVGLLGVSMGGQGALKLAYDLPELFPAVAAISPAVEYQELYWSGSPIDDMYTSKEQCRQDTAIMHIHPANWPRHQYFCMDPDDAWFRGCDRLHSKLLALGVPHECELTTRGGGHTWDYFNRMAKPALQFIVAGLEKESRRLV